MWVDLRSQSGYLHSLTANVKKWLDIEVVGRQDDLEEHLLVNLNELSIPVRDVGGASARLFSVIGGGGRVATVVGAVLENLYGASKAVIDWSTCVPSILKAQVDVASDLPS